MKKLQIKLYDKCGDYYNEMKEIYDQFVISKGGFLHEQYCLIDYVLSQTDKNKRKLYTACAFIGEKLVGFAMLSHIYPKNELYVSLIAVDKNYQGRGIGKALMNYAIHHSKGYASITSGAYLKNTASLHLHRETGFIIYSARKCLSGEHAGDKYLCFVRQPPQKNLPLKCEEQEVEANL